ncbi:PIG-L deacetylase family protein [Pseudonocardia sp. CA-107938]|uniref:PIG-L deacetylase family protein n=1 Tax=Pseudonocardia sp. CA-107938 TaxID=3240021 RepID=UPI003D8DEC21
MASTRTLSGHTVVALHAHPDDEAIFTGITLRRLAAAGARTVLVVATSGDLGASRVPLRRGETVPQRRIAELERAAELLGVARLVLMGRRDSGLPGWKSTRHARALAAAPVLPLARSLAELADAEGATALVHDDEDGIYGHPDHAATHRIGAAAADLAGITSYRTTVDRDALSPAGHLVHGAADAAGVRYGRPTGDIMLSVAGDGADIAVKRAAILAHESQVSPADVPEEGFEQAYGQEWYLRSGAAGPLDLLAATHADHGVVTPAP